MAFNSAISSVILSSNRNTNERLHQIFREVEFQQMMFRDIIKGLKGQTKEAVAFFDTALQQFRAAKDGRASMMCLQVCQKSFAPPAKER